MGLPSGPACRERWPGPTPIAHAMGGGDRIPARRGARAVRSASCAVSLVIAPPCCCCGGDRLGISRRITTPLVRVTEAAEAVAESRRVVRVEIDREDEIGRLADSFNTMARKVEQSRLDLELRVETHRGTAARPTASSRRSATRCRTTCARRCARLPASSRSSRRITPRRSTHDGGTRLERVRVNARRMGQLIDDLLAFSRIGRATDARGSASTSPRWRARPPRRRSPPPAAPIDCRSSRCRRAGRGGAAEPGVRQPGLERGEVHGRTSHARDHDRLDAARRRDDLFRARQRRRLRRAVRGEAVRRVPAPARAATNSKAPASAWRSSHRIIIRHGGRVWAEGRVKAGRDVLLHVASWPR